MTYYAGYPIDLEDHPRDINKGVVAEPIRVGRSYVRHVERDGLKGLALFSVEVPRFPAYYDSVAAFEKAAAKRCSSKRDVPDPSRGRARSEPQAHASSSGGGMCQSAGSSTASSSGGGGGAGRDARAGVAPAPDEVVPLAYWVPRTGGEVHAHAVTSGRDLDSASLYVGRASIMGQLLPGKVNPQHRVCYVAVEGREIAVHLYEVLVLDNLQAVWEPAEGGRAPVNAFPAGLTLQGEPIYSVRAIVRDIVTPGMLMPGDTFCRISYDLKEFRLNQYDVLTVAPLTRPKKKGHA